MSFEIELCLAIRAKGEVKKVKPPCYYIISHLNLHLNLILPVKVRFYPKNKESYTQWENIKDKTLKSDIVIIKGNAFLEKKTYDWASSLKKLKICNHQLIIIPTHIEKTTEEFFKTLTQKYDELEKHIPDLST